MTIDDRLQTMTAIGGQQSDTTARAVVVEVLIKWFTENPEKFWEHYFEMLYAANPSPYKRLAEELLKRGAVDGTTTFGEALTLVDGEAA